MAEVTATSAIKSVHNCAHELFKDFTEEDWIAWNLYCHTMAITPTYEAFHSEGACDNG